MEFRRVFGQIFGLETTIAAVVFGLVVAGMLTAFAISWRRRRRGKPSVQRSEHNLVETVFVLLLAGLAIYIATASLTSNAKEHRDPAPGLQVQVTAYQWCWRFHYAGQPVTVSADCGGGPVPTLALPTGRPIELNLTSQDVIHAFWVPYLRYKMDIYPQHVNHFTFTLTRPGRWLGECAQFCGLQHYEMHFYLQAMSPPAFDHWLKARGGSAGAVSGR